MMLLDQYTSKRAEALLRASGISVSRFFATPRIPYGRACKCAHRIIVVMLSLMDYYDEYTVFII